MSRLLAEALEMNRRLRRFAEQDLERRHVGIPLDQGRNGAEALERLPIEQPNGWRHARAVVVDAQHFATFELAHGVPGEMDLADRASAQGGEISARVPAVIAGAHVDVVDVAQNAAAGTGGNGGKEFPLGNRRMLEREIRRRILDEDAALEKGLCLIDVATDDIERFLGQWQRQQVTEIRAGHDAPRKMLGHEPRFETL